MITLDEKIHILNKIFNRLDGEIFIEDVNIIPYVIENFNIDNYKLNNNGITLYNNISNDYIISPIKKNKDKTHIMKCSIFGIDINNKNIKGYCSNDKQQGFNFLFTNININLYFYFLLILLILCYYYYSDYR